MLQHDTSTTQHGSEGESKGQAADLLDQDLDSRDCYYVDSRGHPILDSWGDPIPNESMSQLENLVHTMEGGQQWNLIEYLGGTKKKSAVYKAEHPSHGTAVLKFQATRDDTTKRRFKREISMLSRCTHQNIIAAINANPNPMAITRSGVSDRTLMVGVLEYMPGESVDGLVKEYGTLAESVIVNMARCVLNGLTKIHAMNIVHRDIKCANILSDERKKKQVEWDEDLPAGWDCFMDHMGMAEYVNEATGDITQDKPGPTHAVKMTMANPGGNVFKIIDFGIAKMMLVNSEGSSNISGTMVTDDLGVKGTCHYMSPEQFTLHGNEGENDDSDEDEDEEQEETTALDHRTDIWSLGVVIYRCLVGKLPFARNKKSMFQIAEVIRKSNGPPKSFQKVLVSDTLRHIVTKALQNNPKDRYSTATEMLNAFEAYVFVSFSS
jgi:serine/threonine protein kinase